MPLFHLGTLEVTPSASAVLAAVGADAAVFFARHQQGDWGEEDEDMQQENAFAVQQNRPIYSTYKFGGDSTILVITTADQSSTRMQLAAECPIREVGLLKGYALWAESYDSEKNALIAVEEPQVDALVATLPMTAVLDVGTGTGRHALKLARRGVTVTAIDQSPEMLGVAQRAARTEGVTIDFQLASLGDDLPFSVSQFDFMICALMLSHVAHLFEAIQEFSRLLRGDSFLLITDFHPDAVGRGWRAYVDRSEIRYALPNSAHTRSKYLKALAKANFLVRKVIDIPVRDVPDGYLSRAFIHEHGEKLFCLIILAQKQAH